MPVTKKFNGETFRRKDIDVALNKSEAERVAKQYRKDGYLARVVRDENEFGGYSVYTKKKVYRAHQGNFLTDAKGRKTRITR